MPDLNKALHKTIKKVTEDLEHLRFNTAINNDDFFECGRFSKVDSKMIWKDFIRLVGPFGSHLPKRFGPVSVVKGLFLWLTGRLLMKPCIDNMIKMVLQVNGKKRDEIDIPRDMPKDEVEKLALANERVILWAKRLAGYCGAGCLVNIVI